MNNTILQRPLNRRHFIRNSALAAFTAALAGNALSIGRVAASGNYSPAKRPSLAVPQGDLDILNYALTLEHLEASAYADANNSGLLSGMAATYFKAFGGHETTHVDTLAKVIGDLGGTPVKAQATYYFPKLNNQQEILQFFQVVEELGAAAYLGQAPRLVTADLITAAVSIHNVEAQHAAALSDLLNVSPSPAFAEPKSMEEVLMVVTPFLMQAESMPGEMPATGGGGLQRHYTRQAI